MSPRGKVVILTIDHFCFSSWIESHQYLVDRHVETVLIELNDIHQKIIDEYYRSKEELSDEQLKLVILKNSRNIRIQKEIELGMRKKSKSEENKVDGLMDSGCIQFIQLCKKSKINICCIDKCYWELGLPYKNFYDQSKPYWLRTIMDTEAQIDPARETHMKKEILRFLEDHEEVYAIMHHMHADKIFPSIDGVEKEYVDQWN